MMIFSWSAKFGASEYPPCVLFSPSKVTFKCGKPMLLKNFRPTPRATRRSLCRKGYSKRETVLNGQKRGLCRYIDDIYDANIELLCINV